MKDKIIKNPVCSVIATLIIIITLLFFINVINPCAKDMVYMLINNFIHTDIPHLFFNLYGLYILTTLEQKIGALKFSGIMFILLFINTAIEYVLHKILNIPCSVGFSGILYSLFAWEIMSGNKDFNLQIPIAIFLDVILVLYSDKKIALLNHAIGVFSGILIGNFLKF